MLCAQIRPAVFQVFNEFYADMPKHCEKENHFDVISCIFVQIEKGIDPII